MREEAQSQLITRASLERNRVTREGIARGGVNERTELLGEKNLSIQFTLKQR